MKMETAVVFREALLGLQTMHHGGWIHRDLKPSNIGVVGTPARAILLDNGTSAHVEPGCMIRSDPGTIGTLGFLAPELEIQHYDHSIDIWAMGIILFWLTYNQYPWKMNLNPFRGGFDKDAVRPFERFYSHAIAVMTADYIAARQAPTEGYIHREYSIQAYFIQA